MVKENSGGRMYMNLFGFKVYKGFCFWFGRVVVGELVVVCFFYVKVKGLDGFDVW